MRKAQAISSELSIARESATVNHILVESQRQAKEGDRVTAEEKERLQVLPDWKLLAQRCCRQATQKWGILCDWLELCTCLSLVGPKLKVGTKIREALSYSSSPGLLGLISSEVILQPPGLSLEIVIQLPASWLPWWFIVHKGIGFLGRFLQVVGQNSVFIWSGHFLFVYSVSQYFFRGQLPLNSLRYFLILVKRNIIQNTNVRYLIENLFDTEYLRLTDIQYFIPEPTICPIYIYLVIYFNSDSHPTSFNSLSCIAGEEPEGYISQNPQPAGFRFPDEKLFLEIQKGNAIILQQQP